MIHQEEIAMLTKKLELKHQCWYQIYVILVMCILLWKEPLLTEPDNAKRNRSVAFKNNAPFINCTSKISGVQIDNAEDLDVVMPMYNLLEYSKNYKKTTGSLWNYYRDQPSNPLSTNSESFKYKTSITRNTYNVGDDEEGYDANKVGKNETEVVIPLKHLSNFWKSLNIPLINCEVEIVLTWTKIVF